MSRIFDLNRRLDKSLDDTVQGTLVINITKELEPCFLYNNKPITFNQYSILVNRIKKSSTPIEFNINIID
ncbi:MAG: hypothetical protein H9W82_12435 [Lactobacillus sp.]|nr:hypothetical protein [Lactobacillus sp.]SCI53958.1 Uncharacterised protein [uncultured Clostridium sp.]